jgi:beta-glucosidase
MASSALKTAFLLGGLLSLPSNAHDLARRQQAANATYKNPSASVDDRVSDLLSRMTIEEKTAQLIQGDISNWINTTTNAFNSSGLEWNFNVRAGQFYVGYAMPPEWISAGIKRAQDYIMHNTTLGIPALVQTEGIHGVLYGNATIFNSPIAHACSWDPELIHEMAVAIAKESQAIGINQLFAPVVDLARELRYGRVEETYGEDHFLAGEMGYQCHSKALCRLQCARTRPQHWTGPWRRARASYDLATVVQACYHRRECMEYNGSIP